MGKYGELFPGRKLEHQGDQGTAGRQHDPGGPLDLESGVVYLAPPQPGAEAETEESDGSEQD